MDTQYTGLGGSLKEGHAGLANVGRASYIERQAVRECETVADQLKIVARNARAVRGPGSGR